MPRGLGNLELVAPFQNFAAMASSVAKEAIRQCHSCVFHCHVLSAYFSASYIDIQSKVLSVSVMDSISIDCAG